MLKKITQKKLSNQESAMDLSWIVMMSGVISLYVGISRLLRVMIQRESTNEFVNFVGICVFIFAIYFFGINIAKALFRGKSWLLGVGLALTLGVCGVTVIILSFFSRTTFVMWLFGTDSKLLGEAINASIEFMFSAVFLSSPQILVTKKVKESSA